MLLTTCDGFSSTNPSINYTLQQCDIKNSGGTPEYEEIISQAQGSVNSSKLFGAYASSLGGKLGCVLL